MTRPLNDHQIEQIREELRNRRKLDAVRHYKEWTGCSLAEAKRSVERIGREGEAIEGDAFATNQAQMDKILDLLAAGKKLEAVKIYKEASGQSLMDSKKFIEQLMEQLGIEDPGAKGCGAAVLIIIVIVVIVISRLV